MDEVELCLFTKESITKIENAAAEKKAAKELAKQKAAEEGTPPQELDEEHKPHPNIYLEAGKPLPKILGDCPPELVGKPIEDLDTYYSSKMTFMVIARDKGIFRFSATNGFFILSPFNPVRRAAIYVLVHPLFSLFIMIVILVNCGFMASNAEVPYSEEIFTAIYTFEGVTKMLSRGFILSDFTYLRDAWNWLDFIVVALAYITMAFPLGNLAALRTCRVLRALKTIAVVPGLKTIIGALMEAVRRLRDVIILTFFVLSIFALIGLQIYPGTLKQKCVLIPDWIANGTEAELKAFRSNESNWYWENGVPKLCGKSEDAGKCPENYECFIVGPNPNFGYTNFDNFGWALLCTFRLMTQDFWENLYQIIIRANGPYHMLFFVAIIFLGSFYLVNLILAIVAMSYDDCQKLAQEEREAEEAEAAEIEARRMAKEAAANAAANPTTIRSSPSGDSYPSVVHSSNNHLNKSDAEMRCSQNNISNAVTVRRDSQFSWKDPTSLTYEQQKSVLPYLENLSLPYADDSTASTPMDQQLDHVPSNSSFLHAPRQRVSSSMSFGHQPAGGNRQPSIKSRQGRRPSRQVLSVPGFRFSDKKKEPTHFQWTGTFHQAMTNQMVIQGPSNTNLLGDQGRHNVHSMNSCGSHRPSTSVLNADGVLIVKDSGKEMENGEPMSRKEWLKEKCCQLMFDWECCPCWYQFARILELFITDAFIDMFITICIVVNTVFMAMDHANMSEQMAETLKYGNYVFTTIFAAEAFIKILALGLYKYLKDKWNCFDIVIVLLSLVELGLANVKGLSILRSFRLLRVFKLAKSWPTLNLLIGIIGRTMGALGNLCFVLLIVIFIFAVMGMQLFGESYKVELLRWNFLDFLHSFMIVFRVLCGEWIESMWDCMRLHSFSCIPFFLLTMIIGNLVVLNLFLALLLSSFGAESLSGAPTEEAEPNKLQEAADRIGRFIIYVKSHIAYCFKVKLRRKLKHDMGPNNSAEYNGADYIEKTYSGANGRILDFDGRQDGGGDNHLRYNTVKTHVFPESTGEINGKILRGDRSVSEIDISFSRSTLTFSQKSLSERDVNSLCLSLPMISDDRDSTIVPDDANSYVEEESDFESSLTSIGTRKSNLEINDVKVMYIRYPDECCPKCYNDACTTCLPPFNRSSVGQIWQKWRMLNLEIVEHNIFETFIIVMILASSGALAIEDVNLPNRPWLIAGLYYADKIFTVIFIGEMIIKMSAYGFKKYFTDAWCWLDFIIVAISLVSLGAEILELGNIGPFRALRTLRALRPLRAVSRWEGMRVVVNALVQAIPSIFNVLLVCLVFWLIFSIMAVNLFGGRFASCIDQDGAELNVSIVANVEECLNKSAELNCTWENPKVNFDNVLIAYLALFQVATFKGWIDIMNNAIDSKEPGMQPEYEIRVMMYLYFVFFIVFGSFFTLNLFIGVIIENFNAQKKKMTGGSLEMFMSEDQKKYYNAMKKLGSKEPQKPIPKPKLKIQLFFFNVITNQKFDILIMIVIMLNMVTMSLDHYEMEEDFENVLWIINTVFIVIFTCECLMKLISLRWYYFKAAWNNFDFVVVVISVLGLFLSDLIANYFVSPTLLRVVRVFRVGRILRLVKSAKGIRTLLFSLAVSMPALFNIGLLLFLVMFIFSIFGMNFFMHVKHTAGVDDLFNFETFFRSMISLFQISTSAGWDGTLAGLMNDEPPNCNNTSTDMKPNGDCGSTGMAIMFLVAYLIMSFLVVVNMYIAVILENFSQVTEDVQEGITQDDFDMYYEIWERFDEKATQYIPLEILSEFVDTLEEPLRIPARNHYKLVTMRIPICEGDLIHCVDLLDALTKNYLGTQAEEGDLADLQTGPERKDYHPISNMFLRQRQIYCATIIQRAWRQYLNRKYGRRPDKAKSAFCIDIESDIDDEDLPQKSDAESEYDDLADYKDLV